MPTTPSRPPPRRLSSSASEDLAALAATAAAAEEAATDARTALSSDSDDDQGLPTTRSAAAAASPSSRRGRSTTSSTAAVAPAGPLTASTSLGRGLFSSSFGSTSFLRARGGGASTRRRRRGQEQQHQQDHPPAREGELQGEGGHPTTTTAGVPPAAASASASRGSSAGEQQRALHEEIAWLHRSLGLAAQEGELLREEARAKEALASRLQEQNDALLREAKVARARLKRAEQDKARAVEEKAAALVAGASQGQQQQRTQQRSSESLQQEAGAAASQNAALRAQLDRAMAQLRECLETIEGLEASLTATERERDIVQHQLQQQLQQQALAASNGGLGGGHAVALLEEELGALRRKYAKAKAALKACREEEGAARRLLNEHMQHQHQHQSPSQHSLLSHGHGGGGSPARASSHDPPGEVRRLRTRVRELEAVLAKAEEVDRESQAAQRGDAERLASDRRRLVEAEARLRAEAAGAVERAAAAEARVAQLEGKVRRAKQAAGEAQGEARELRRRFKEHLEETTGVVAELEKARGERARRAQELAAVQAALADTRGQLEEALGRCVAWERERQVLLKELQAEKGRARGLETAIAEAADRIVGYEEELQRVQGAAAAETAAAEVLRRTSQRLEQAVGVGAASAFESPSRRWGSSSSSAAAAAPAIPPPRPTGPSGEGTSRRAGSSVSGRDSGNGGAAARPSPALLDTLARLRQATARANAATLESAIEEEEEGAAAGRPRSPSLASASSVDDRTVVVPHGEAAVPASSAAPRGGLGELLARCRTLKAELAAVIEEDERLQGQQQSPPPLPPPRQTARTPRGRLGEGQGSNTATERLM